jgi:thiosulfate/3-mercaptopyruvate sulfurtransferase
MTSPFITLAELTSALDSSSPPVVLDASFVLKAAKFDGDYSKESGLPLYLKAHIPGAIHVDVATQFSDISQFSDASQFSEARQFSDATAVEHAAPTHYAHPEPQAIADELARLGIDEHRSIVIYDQTGGLFAARLWYLLTWIGADARVLDGGFAAWRAAGLDTESGDIEAGRREPLSSVDRWTATAVREAWISKEALAERAADDSRPLVCGLPAGSFTGADPTRYSRRGHIPGSVNVSARDLFAADGTVKDVDALRAAYESEGVTGESEVLLYCGGGISASANAITLVELGVTAVRIYDGSLEEWSADAALPLVTG